MSAGTMPNPDNIKIIMEHSLKENDWGALPEEDREGELIADISERRAITGR